MPAYSNLFNIFGRQFQPPIEKVNTMQNGGDANNDKKGVVYLSVDDDEDEND